MRNTHSGEEQTEEGIAIMIRILDGEWRENQAVNGGWLHAATIVDRARVQFDLEWNDRDVRDFSNLSHGQIGSGQKGYKLTQHMSEAEKNHARAVLDSQSDKMRNRSNEIEQCWQEAQSKQTEMAL